jgi:hypothetical protein
MTRPAPSLPPPSKKRRIQKESGFSKSIQELEEQITAAAAANSSLNPLVDLLNLAFTTDDAQDTSKAIYSLYRVFVIIISGGKLSSSGDDAAKVVKAWIWDKLNSYVDFLCGLLKDEEKLLRVILLLVQVFVDAHVCRRPDILFADLVFSSETFIDICQLVGISASIPYFAFPKNCLRLAIMSPFSTNSARRPRGA